MTDDARLTDFLSAESDEDGDGARGGSDAEDVDAEDCDVSEKERAAEREVTDSDDDPRSGTDPRSDDDSRSDGDRATADSSGIESSEPPNGVDSSEGDRPAASDGVDPAAATYACGEYACGECGAETDRVWRVESDRDRGSAYVCPDCKPW
ncbi:hypothetical protein ACFQGT_12680 [Natrialbaceae archaeon GCM10025810]|uniref:DUF7573 domain-containing protein n=1 Tax=Halovalidus salilacus TaxID=3075124 RepID=UPI003611E8D1